MIMPASFAGDPAAPSNIYRHFRGAASRSHRYMVKCTERKPLVMPKILAFTSDDLRYVLKIIEYHNLSFSLWSAMNEVRNRYQLVNKAIRQELKNAANSDSPRWPTETMEARSTTSPTPESALTLPPPSPRTRAALIEFFGSDGEGKDSPHPMSASSTDPMPIAAPAAAPASAAPGITPPSHASPQPAGSAGHIFNRYHVLNRRRITVRLSETSEETLPLPGPLNLSDDKSD